MCYRETQSLLKIGKLIPTMHYLAWDVVSSSTCHLLLQCFPQAVFLNDRYVPYMHLYREWALESSSLGLNSGSTSYWLCDLKCINIQGSYEEINCTRAFERR